MKNFDISTSEIKSNILKHYTGDNIKWYSEYNTFLHKVAKAYGISFYKVVGIFAVYSANASIDMNLQHFYTFIQNPYKVTGLTSAYTKALNIFVGNGRFETGLDIISKNPDQTKVSNAYKIRSFYINLCFPKFNYKFTYVNSTQQVDRFNAITIDRHALLIAVPNFENSLTKNVYTFIANIYNQVAKQLGITCQELQADTWVNYRIYKGVHWYSQKENEWMDTILQDSYIIQNIRSIA